MTGPLTHLSGIVARGAAAWPDRVALEDAQGRAPVTYGSLAGRVAAGATRLRAAGLAPGDRVLLVMDATTDWMPSLFAILAADLTAVPLPGGTPAPLVGLVAAYAAVGAVVHDTANPVAPSPGSRRVTLTPGELAAGAPADEPPPAGFSNPTAVLVFTSGSTARPRAVALSHPALLANLRAVLAVRTAAPGETLLSVLPPAHLYELVAGQLAPLASGARIVYGGPPLPNRLIDAIGERAVTRMLLVPSLVEALSREVLEGLVARRAVPRPCAALGPADLVAHLDALEPDARGRLLAQVRTRLGPTFRSVAVGGAALDPAWADVLGLVGLDVDLGYGLTEAGPLVSLGRACDSPRGSVGRPLPGVDVRIAGDGEILVRSAALMQGYAGDPAGTTAAVRDGWLHTGDRGRLDAEGYLTITGRIKEAIVTTSGETLYPDELEPHYASPLFAEWCVVPVPDPDGNDRAVLVVVPATGTAPGDLDAAFAALRAAAPPRCRVAAIRQRHEPLPRTALGKIRRRFLADAMSGPGGVS